MNKNNNVTSKTNAENVGEKKVAQSSILALFLTMFKIGLFTFGGGYAMIAIMEREIIEKKKWIEKEDFIDLIGISESTPGPLAVNSATYIGYKIHGFWGSFFSTLGAVLPSFIIIFLISLFFEKFMSLTYVGYAFMGIQACVAFIIISAGIKMLKNVEKNALNVILFVLTIVTYSVFSLLSIGFSSVYYILIGGTIGVLIYLINSILLKKKKITEEGKGDRSVNSESLENDDIKKCEIDSNGYSVKESERSERDAPAKSSESSCHDSTDDCADGNFEVKSDDDFGGKNE